MMPANVWRWLMGEADIDADLDARARLVLHILALHADDRGIARPGLRRIADLAGLASPSSARAAIERLTEAGLVLKASGGHTVGRSTTVYGLTLGRTLEQTQAELFAQYPQSDAQAGDKPLARDPGSRAIARDGIPLARDGGGVARDEIAVARDEIAVARDPGSRETEHEHLKQVPRDGWGTQPDTTPSRIADIRKQLRKPA